MAYAYGGSRRLEILIYSTRGKHANPFATTAVSKKRYNRYNVKIIKLPKVLF
jgi:hypothetical protein